MRILFFGTYDEDRHPRVKVLREGFIEHGDEVLVCNEPLRADTAHRVAILRAPWRAFGLLLSVARAWSRLRRRARTMPAPDAVVVGYLGHLDVHLARRLWPGVPIVLDHLISLRDTAVDRRAGGRWLLGVLAFFDRAATRKAHLVVVDTDEHLSLLPADARTRAIVVPVGAPRSWFLARRHDRTDALRVVFFGLYTPLQGAVTIGEAISLLAGAPIGFTMIGSGQDLAATREAARANAAATTWIDWMQPADLPDVVASHDICLGIVGASAKASRVVPNKVFQGAAAGCAIVTGDTPPQRRALEDAAVFVAPDAQALAEALRELASDPERVASLAKAASHRADEGFGPAVVVEDLRSRLVEGVAMGKDLPPLSPNAWLRHDLIFDALERAGTVRSLLEIGAGAGAMGARLAQRFDYTGVEPDPVSFATARERIGGTGAVLNGGTDLLVPDRRFDAVCAFEVLEHIEDDVAALRDWRDRLKPGGVLVLSVPAHQARFAAADRKAGHFRRYERDGLEDALSAAGFVDPEIRTYGLGLGFVLEWGRNLLASREERRSAATTSIVDRTSASGRWHQPPEAAAGLIRIATAPFRALQRSFVGTSHGTGFVVRARRPE